MRDDLGAVFDLPRPPRRFVSLVPITLVLITLFFFRRQVERTGDAVAQAA